MINPGDLVRLQRDAFFFIIGNGNITTKVCGCTMLVINVKSIKRGVNQYIEYVVLHESLLYSFPDLMRHISYTFEVI